MTIPHLLIDEHLGGLPSLKERAISTALKDLDERELIARQKYPGLGAPPAVDRSHRERARVGPVPTLTKPALRPSRRSRRDTREAASPFPAALRRLSNTGKKWRLR